MAEKKVALWVHERADMSVVQLGKHWVASLAVMMAEPLVDESAMHLVERMVAKMAEKKVALLVHYRADMSVAHLAEHWVASLDAVMAAKLVD